MKYLDTQMEGGKWGGRAAPRSCGPPSRRVNAPGQPSQLPGKAAAASPPARGRSESRRRPLFEPQPWGQHGSAALAATQPATQQTPWPPHPIAAPAGPGAAAAAASAAPAASAAAAASAAPPAPPPGQQEWVTMTVPMPSGVGQHQIWVTPQQKAEAEAMAAAGQPLPQHFVDSLRGAAAASPPPPPAGHPPADQGRPAPAPPLPPPAKSPGQPANVGSSEVISVNSSSADEEVAIAAVGGIQAKAKPGAAKRSSSKIPKEDQ